MAPDDGKRWPHRVLRAARARPVAAQVALAAVLFWGLRITYWASTSEELFSDMADFRGIAVRFAAGGTLAMDAFWQSYRAPVLPLLGALPIALFGEAMWPWQALQAAILFGGACWLAYEVRLASGRPWLGAWLLLLVAVSRPSVFWSLKFAKEGLHEALLYVVLAAVLRLLRRPGVWFAVLVGALLFAAALNRSNFVVAVPVVLVAALCPARGHGSRWSRVRRQLPVAGALALGVLLAWAPWAWRTAQLYGRPLLLTTDGAAVALDGLHQIDVAEPDGTILHLQYNDYLAAAPTRFATDADADAWLGPRVRRWVMAHFGEWVAGARHRVRQSCYDREIRLTRVPREHQLPPWLDWLLLDKHRTATRLGLLGLLLAGVLHRRLLLLVLLTVPPWLVACCFLGLPRLFEPIVPLVWFGNALLLAVMWSWGRAAARRLRRSR